MQSLCPNGKSLYPNRKNLYPNGKSLYPNGKYTSKYGKFNQKSAFQWNVCVQMGRCPYNIPCCASYNKFLCFIIIGSIILALITSHTRPHTIFENF